MQNGLIHLYFGDGKGKTSAALGLGLRAFGRGRRVLLARFLKDGNSGELAALAALPGFEVIASPETARFTFQMSPSEKEAAAALCRALLTSAAGRAEDFDLLILDEAVTAVSLGMLPEESLSSFLRGRPERLEVVLTGHSPSKGLIEIAAYASEIKKIKHPYDRGAIAREGIEY